MRKHAGRSVLGQLQWGATTSTYGQREEGLLHGAPVIHLGFAHRQAQTSGTCMPEGSTFSAARLSLTFARLICCASKPDRAWTMHHHDQFDDAQTVSPSHQVYL